MGNFDNVIGYEAIKKELNTVIDMIKNKEAYEKLGAKLPNGIFLCGKPGVGKTLIATSFIEASGLKTITLRRNKESQDFIEEISKAFEDAVSFAPSIILLDDLDKFANADEEHRNAEEYIAVQSGIDSVKGKNVIVFATANDIKLLPNSLTRSGRFDIKIRVKSPTIKDSEEIAKHYLEDKQVDKNIKFEDLVRIIDDTSCAELESVINEAAIHAASERKGAIDIDDVIKTVLKRHFGGVEEVSSVSERQLKERAIHEAGHLVVSEVLKDKSVGMAAVGVDKNGDVGGFVHRCSLFDRRSFEIVGALAGKAAVELRMGRCPSGCQGDLEKASNLIIDGLNNNATLGLNLLTFGSHVDSEKKLEQTELIVGSELNRFMFITKDIILKNEEFFNKIVDVLLEKKVIVFSEIQELKDTCEITPVEIA